MNHPPTIFESTINGQRYAVSGAAWIPIPNNWSLDYVREWWASEIAPTRVDPITKRQQWNVLSSNGKDTYTVTKHSDHFTCTCIGYKTHGGAGFMCKHIKKVVNDLVEPNK
jgi:hypothetical protein